MRVLYVTHNSHLRSTTCSLDAVFGQLRGTGLEPVMLFREPGPWQRQLAESGVPCYFHPLDTPDKRHPLRTARQLASLVRLLRKERIELIQCNEHDHYPLLRIPARWLEVPVIVTARFVIGRDYIRWAFRSPYRPARVQFTSRDQLASCRAALLEEVSEDRIALIMNGRSFQDFVPSSAASQELRKQWNVRPGTFVVGTASTIRPRKRLEDFIDLVGRLRREGEDVIGVIAGGGKFGESDYEQVLRKRIREQQLDGACLMLGNLEQIAPFMAAIDLMVSTSEMETFGMSVCEAMACGKPVLAYDAGSLAEVVADSWCMVPFGDLDTLAERALTLIREPRRYRQIAEAGARHVRANFDAPVIAARQWAIYEQVLASSPGTVQAG